MAALRNVFIKGTRGLRAIYYRLPVSTQAARLALRKFPPPYKLNLGCGAAAHPGWVNVDVSFSANADLRWDLRRPFPLPSESCSRIYHESLFEIFQPEEGRAFLSNCRGLLMPGGIIRMAMPSLEDIVSLYLSGDWRQFDWREPGYRHYETVRNGAQMINRGFRHPDNQWLYDWEDLTRVIREAGFDRITRAAWGESEYPEFRNLETRPESQLICEIHK